jgi:hypothetical protein
METVRRDWIKKQIIAGNVLIKCDMILTDDYAMDNALKFQKTENWEKADIKNFSDQDFKYKSGHAYWANKAEGIISWTMLCNHYYTIKIVKGEK